MVSHDVTTAATVGDQSERVILDHSATIIDLGIARVKIGERTLKQRLNCNQMIRRWAKGQAESSDDGDLRAHRANFVAFSSYSTIVQLGEGFESFRLPCLEMSDEEFETAFVLYLEIAECQFNAWNRAVTEASTL